MLLVPLVFAGGLRASDLEVMWDHVARSRTTEAQVEFRRTGAADARERVLAGAVITLARPPVAEGRLAALQAELAGLARDDDEIAALALYLQARVQQVHLSRPDYPRAAALYRELARRWPDSHWAQLGLVKLGLLTLYALPEPAEPVARLAAAEALLSGIGERALRRDLQLQLGQAALDFGRPPEEALPHLIAAEAAGGLLGVVAEDLLIQAGELSLRAGRVAAGRAYLEKFLREFPAASRRFTVEQRLAGLPAGEDAP